MHADCFFRMGATHAVCQDYAMAGQVDGVHYAILSDGCSGSENTDFGARFLARAAHYWLREMRMGVFPGHEIMLDSARMAAAARLSRQSLDATLLVACVNEKGSGVQTYQAGDGVIVGRRRTGELDFYSSEFSEGAPLYLSYLLSDSGRARFNELGQRQVIRTRLDTFEVEPEVCRRVVFDRRDYDLVALLSDGAESFHTKDGQQVPLDQVLEQVFAIKGFTGEFFGRRCNRFLGPFCAERGWKHADDFSIAGIYLGDEP